MLKAQYDNDSGEYFCSENSKCTNTVEFIDKNNLIAKTVPMSSITTKSNQQVKAFDPVNVEISVYNDKFTNNHIKVYYYEEPEYIIAEPETASAIQESSILIEADFKLDKNNMDLFTEYGTFR